ncbi:MAG: SDR family oxidoreductase [Candidatus Lokiarchaeota archaeon]|nr:SDR family oxidoreductase [Candidatus Lokiarchaeota archaeon]
MDLIFQDKIILITGSSKGLGYACAKILAEEGAHVILSSRSEKNLKNAAERIVLDTGLKPDWIVSDVSNLKDIEKLKNTVISKYEKLDGLVINAGGPPTGSSLEMTEEQWQNALNTNFLSVVRLTKAFIPLMQQKTYGRVVAITSVSAKQPLPNLVLSNSTRLAVVGYLKTLANEVGRDNILINVVMPGTINTERLQQVIQGWAKVEGKTKEQITQSRTSQIPIGRFGEPEEIGSFVTFLVSGRNTYITGQVIPVDGGFIKSSL